MKSSIIFRFILVVPMLLSIPITPLMATIKEHSNPQDEIRFQQVDSTHGLVYWKLDTKRSVKRPLTLYIPDDIQFDLSLVNASARLNGQNLIFPSSEIHCPTNYMVHNSYRCGHYPVHTFYIVSIPTISPEVSNDDLPANPVSLESTTYEITFNKPFEIYTQNNPKQNSNRSNETFFYQHLKRIVANPWNLPPHAKIDEKYTSNCKYPWKKFDLLSSKAIRIECTEIGLINVDIKEMELIDPKKDLNYIQNHLHIIKDGTTYPYLISQESILIPNLTSSTFFLAYTTEPGCQYKEFNEKQIIQPTQEQWIPKHIEKDLIPLMHTDDPNGFINYVQAEFMKDGDNEIIDFDLNNFKNIDDSSKEAIFIFKYNKPNISSSKACLSYTINGQNLAPSNISDITDYFHIRVPYKYLREKANRLEIFLSGNIPVIANRIQPISLDWLEIWYQSELIVDKLPLQNNYHRNISNENINQPFLHFYKVDSLKDISATCFIHNISKENYYYHVNNGIMPVYSIQSPWIIVKDGSFIKPSISVVDLNNNIKESIDKDLVVITDPMFVNILNNYLLNSNQKYSIYTTQEIYNRYSWGIPGPFPIKNFLKDIFDQSSSMNVVWLVGECRWDPDNKQNSTVKDLVPSPAIQTSAGISSNDQWYTQLAGDDVFPDLFIARVSVSTTAELTNYLHKTESSRKFNPGWWRVSGLFLADDGFSPTFDLDFQNGLINYLIPEVFTSDGYPLDVIRNFEAVGKIGKEARGAREDIVNRWNQGASFVTYVGHGGITVWSHEALFKGLNRPDSDVNRLTNKDHYPFVLVRSCMSSAANWPTFPGEVSVAESLIKAGNSGAIGVLGSAGTEFAADQERYAEKVYSAIWNQRIHELALIRAYAHYQYLLETPDAPSVAEQFMLHGDPLLNVSFPEEISNASVEWVMKQDNPIVKVKFPAPLSGNCQARFYSNLDLIHESFTQHLDGTTEIMFGFPHELVHAKDLYLALYQWDKTNQQDSYCRIKMDPFPVQKQVKLVSNTPHETTPEVLLLLDNQYLIHEASNSVRIKFSGINTTTEIFHLEGDLKLVDHKTIPISGRVMANNPNEILFDLSPHAIGLVPIQLRMKFTGNTATKDLEYSGWVLVQDKDKQDIGTPVLIPPDPVVGETVLIEVTIKNSGGAPSRNLTTSASLVLPEGNTQILKHLPVYGKDPFDPILPGNTRVLRWGYEAQDKKDLKFQIAISDGVQFVLHEATTTIKLPPELDVLSIRPLTADKMVPIENPVPFRVVFRNSGEVSMSPGNLIIQDASQGLSTRLELPALDAGEVGEASFSVYTKSSHFHWESRFQMKSTDMTTRTRWKPERFECEVPRIITIAGREISAGTITCHFNTPDDFQMMTPRLWKIGDCGFRIEPTVGTQEILAGRLEILDTGLVRSATHAGVAALQHGKGWYVSAYQFQTHPALDNPPVRIRLPWSKEPVIARIAPSFHQVDNYLGLGYPMPGFHLENPAIDFIVNNDTIRDPQALDPVLIDLHQPGITWLLKSKNGSWPGFAGIKFTALPEVRTPAIKIDTKTHYQVSVVPEWITTIPQIWVVETRTANDPEKWNEWDIHDPNKKYDSTYLQVRLWIDPDTVAKDQVLRSLNIHFSPQ